MIYHDLPWCDTLCHMQVSFEQSLVLFQNQPESMEMLLVQLYQYQLHTTNTESKMNTERLILVEYNIPFEKPFDRLHLMVSNRKSFWYVNVIDYQLSKNK